MRGTIVNFVRITKIKAARGFTLVELMVVVVIVGVMATVVTVSVTDYLVTAKQNVARSEIATIKNALQLFFMEQDRFPTYEEGLADMITIRIGSSRAVVLATARRTSVS